MVMGCVGVWGLICQRSSEQSSCICMTRGRIGAEQQALQIAKAVMQSERAGVGRQMWYHRLYKGTCCVKGRCHTGVCIWLSLPYLFLHLSFPACTCTLMSSCHCHSCRRSPPARFCAPVFLFLGVRTGISHISTDF